MNPKTKNTEKKRRQRCNIKNDPERFDEYKRKDRERKKLERLKNKQKLSKNKSLHLEQKEKARTAKQRYRAKVRAERHRQKENDIVIESKRTNSGKKTQAKRKESERKREQLLKKKLAIAQRKKNVLRVQQWRLRVKLQPSKSPVKSPFRSKYQKYRAVKKIRNQLPNTPSKQEEIMSVLTNTKSNVQTQKKILMADTVIQNLGDSLSMLRQKGTLAKEKKSAYVALQQALVIRAKYGHTTAIRRKLKLTKIARSQGSWWQFSKNRKPRKDRIPDETRSQIVEFFLDSSVSRVVPDARASTVSKDGKDECQAHIMSCTLQDAYDSYKRLYSDHPVSFSTFKRLKPKNVKKVSETNHRTCLCQTCSNVALKAESLKNFITGKKEAVISTLTVVQSKREIARMTVCPYTMEYPKPACLDRTCQGCGPKELRGYYKDVLSLYGKENITWYKWGYITVEKQGNKDKRITSCIAHTTSVTEFMDAFEKDLESFPSHMFRSSWQHSQMSLCIKSLKDNSVALVMDYAENYACRFRNETQNAFFDQNQVCIHPMMLYYRSSQYNDSAANGDQQLLVKHAIIGVTNDDRKDAAGVSHFEAAAIRVAQAQFPALGTVHEWTDGCSAQYKGCRAFHNIAANTTISIQRNFFETSHGKSVCDGLGSIVKNCALQAVVSGREVIANADDLYQFCLKKLQHSAKLITKDGQTYVSIRDFLFVDRKNVDRTSLPEVQTVIGTRKLHAVKNTGKPLLLKTRQVSCYCEPCLQGQSEACEQKVYVQPWNEAVIAVKACKPVQTSVDSSKESPATTSHRRRTDRNAKKKPKPIDSASTKTPPASNKNRIMNTEIGDFVAVKYPQKGKTEIYFAEVLNIDDDDIFVTFMERKGQTYMYPSVEDTSYQDLASIVTKIQSPILKNSRGHYEFSQTSIDEVRQLVTGPVYLK